MGAVGLQAGWNSFAVMRWLNAERAASSGSYTSAPKVRPSPSDASSSTAKAMPAAALTDMPARTISHSALSFQTSICVIRPWRTT